MICKISISKFPDNSRVRCIYLLFVLLSSFCFASRDSATVSTSAFVNADSGRFAPALELNYDNFMSDDAHLLIPQYLADFKKVGVGTVVLRNITPGSNSWERVKLIADACRKNQMNLDCHFFAQRVDSPRLQKLQCFSQIIDSDDCLIPTNSVFLQQSLVRVYKPLTVSNMLDSTRMPIAWNESSPMKGRWREYVFNAQPVQPDCIDYMNAEVSIPEVNQYLINAQRMLGNSYGVTFQCVNFPSHVDPEMIWSEKLPTWFNSNLSLVFWREFSARLNMEPPFFNKGALKESRLSKGFVKAWRDVFALNVCPLVKEAGLDSAVNIDHLPLPAEEISRYFQVPVLNSVSNHAGRMRNRRASGGARLHGRIRVLGRVNPHDKDALQQVKRLLIDGATQFLLFADQQLQIADLRDEQVKSLIAFVNRCSNIMLHTEAPQGILCAAEQCLSIKNNFSFDYLSLDMLGEAEFADGRILLPSGRWGDKLVADVASIKKRGNLYQRLQSAGIVVFDASVIEKMPSEFNWSSINQAFDLRFVRRSDNQSEYFFISNEGDTEGMANLSFNVGSFKTLARWNPRNGGVYAIENYRWTAPGVVSLKTFIASD
ncbi:MAG: hypothetical protein RBT40_14305, partial [Petrimonas sp.]|nr:hypothetical protein [Petrimonas sp.]